MINAGRREKNDKATVRENKKKASMYVGMCVSVCLSVLKDGSFMMTAFRIQMVSRQTKCKNGAMCIFPCTTFRYLY